MDLFRCQSQFVSGLSLSTVSDCLRVCAQVCGLVLNGLLFEVLEKCYSCLLLPKTNDSIVS